MASRDLTQYAAIAAQLLALPKNLAGTALVLEALESKLEDAPLPSVEFDVLFYIERARLEAEAA